MTGICTRILPETNAHCTAAGDLRLGLWLCDPCYYAVRLTVQDGPGQTLRRFVDEQTSPLDWGRGATYCVLLPNGRFKIGFTNEVDRLANRWKSLSRHLGDRVVPLCTEHGGMARETYLHAKFHASRVLVQGEQFEPSPELRAYVTRGHIPEGLEALAEFNRWTPRPGTLRNVKE